MPLFKKASSATNAGASRPAPAASGHLPLDAQQWLQQAQATGYQVALAELLQYRLQRSTKLKSVKSRQARGRAGNQMSKSKGRGMEFDEVRHYQHGDDIRAIDWRVTARTGHTYTKLYREEKERPVFFLVDLSPSMHFGSQLLFKSVQACHLTASLAWRFAHRGDRVGGLVYASDLHHEVKPMARDKGVLRLLHQLVLTHQQATTHSSVSGRAIDFKHNLQRLRQLVKTGAHVILISDFHHLNDDCVRDLRALSQHNLVQGMLVLDPMELALPNSPLCKVQAVDDEFTRDFWLGDTRTATLYQRQASDWLAERQAILRSAGIETAVVDAATPIANQRERLGV